MKPAVRLMVVTEAGFQVGFAPQVDADTRFFKLDVPSREVVELFDVDAMSQVERHDSMAQLDIHNEYSLEDCIKVRPLADLLNALTGCLSWCVVGASEAPIGTRIAPWRRRRGVVDDFVDRALHKCGCLRLREVFCLGRF